MPSPDLSAALDEQILPALFDRLDAAFPEFGWQRTRRGHWQATNRDFTKAQFGAGEKRVVASYPFGFKVHGGAFVTWTSYLNGGTTPRGPQFPDVVRKLAERAGLPFPETPWSPEQRQHAEEALRRRSVLEDFWETSRAALLEDEAKPARDYLIARGFKPDELDSLPIGYYGKPGRVRVDLEKKHDRSEVDGSGLLADRRWENRIVGAWRDRFGRLTTFWARALDDNSPPKYLYLDGAPKDGLFGLDVALSTREGRGDLVLVEGVLDVVLLQARGFHQVAALGGTDLRAESVPDLLRAKVEKFTLALDNDPPGREGTLRAVDVLRKVHNVRNVYVVASQAMGSHKDPDAMVRAQGVEAFRDTVRTAPHAYRFLASHILASRKPAPGWNGHDKARDDALRDALLIYETDTCPESEELLNRHLLNPVIEEVGATNLAWISQELDRKAEERRHRDAQRLRDEDTVRRLGGLLRGALEDLDARPSPTLAKALLSDIAALQANAQDLPAPFSVERLDLESAQIPHGKPSGWRNLDELEVAFNPGELAVLGARTGHGKTSALIGLLHNWLAHTDQAGADQTFVLYSAEEPEVRIYHRLLALTCATLDAESPWSVNSVRDYFRKPDASAPKGSFDLLQEAKDRLRAWEHRLVVIYRPSWSVEDISADARARARTRPLGGILVDYLQRIPPPKGAFDRRDIEVSLVARAFKALAVDVAAPVLAAAQINREAAKLSSIPPGAYDDRDVRNSLRRRRPQLHHLREGGSEQEADLVLGIMNYRADFEEDDREASNVPDVTLLEIGTLKNRYGTPGRWASLAFAGRLGLIRDPQEGEEL